MPRPIRRPRKLAAAGDNVAPGSSSGAAVQSSDGPLPAPAFAASPVRATPSTAYTAPSVGAAPSPIQTTKRHIGDDDAVVDEFGFFEVADVVPTVKHGGGDDSRVGRKRRSGATRVIASSPRIADLGGVLQSDLSALTSDGESNGDGEADDSVMSNETIRAAPQNRKPLAAKTDELQNQLPKRPAVTKSGRVTKKAKSHDIYDQDDEVDDDEHNGQENRGRDTAGRRSRAASKKTTASKVPLVNAGKGRASTRKSRAITPAQDSDEEHSEDDDNVEEVELDLPADAKARLAEIRRQFEQVDRMELEYESLSSNFYSDE